jgi:hypothetical protein
MNYLALCQRAAVECGVASDKAITTALPTVVGATGSLGRVVGWVSDALSDILMGLDDWTFMRSSVLLGGGVTFATVAGQASYPLGVGAGKVGVAADNFGKWDRETFRCYPTSVGVAGEMYLDDIPYDDWRDYWMLGANRSVQTRPIVAAVGSDQSLCLGPPPNELYTIEADYFVAPVNMVLDADIPFGLPTRFHMLVVYKAMQSYAGYESAPEVLQRGTQQYATMYAQLLAARAPRMSWGGSLT